jgi:cell division protein FtsN
MTVSNVKSAQKSGKEYEFYKLLPESEVIPPEVKAYQSTPKSAANNSRYLLQAGSFKNPDDADAMRARLILMGMPNVTTNKATSASGSIWYRVRLGPFPSRSKLNKAYDQLVRLNIQPLQIKVP